MIIFQNVPPVELSRQDLDDVLTNIYEYIAETGRTITYSDIVTTDRAKGIWKKLEKKSQKLYEKKQGKSTKVTFERIEVYVLSYIIKNSPATNGGQKLLAEFGRHTDIEKIIFV